MGARLIPTQTVTQQQNSNIASPSVLHSESVPLQTWTSPHVTENRAHPFRWKATLFRSLVTHSTVWHSLLICHLFLTIDIWTKWRMCEVLCISFLYFRSVFFLLCGRVPTQIYFQIFWHVHVFLHKHLGKFRCSHFRVSGHDGFSFRYWKAHNYQSTVRVDALFRLKIRRIWWGQERHNQIKRGERKHSGNAWLEMVNHSSMIRHWLCVFSFTFVTNIRQSAANCFSPTFIKESRKKMKTIMMYRCAFTMTFIFITLALHLFFHLNLGINMFLHTQCKNKKQKME